MFDKIGGRRLPPRNPSNFPPSRPAPVCKGDAKLTPANETPPSPQGFYDEHYQGAIQPLEVMQATMTHEEFVGFLKGNVIKYGFRAGRKAGESAEKDKVKFNRYSEWLDEAMRGEIIDPRKE